jgi:hypothetical protein
VDVNVWRRVGRRGLFVKVEQMEGKRGEEMGEGKWDADGQERTPNPVANAMLGKRGGKGYMVPEEQWAFGDDTGYHGAAKQAERRS